MFEDAETRRRFLQGIGAAGVAGLAGCSAEDPEASGGGSPAGDGDGDETSGDEGGSDDRRTLAMNAVQRFGTIDPARGTDYTQVMAMVNLYDPLVFPNEAGEIQPHVAEDWSVSDDNRTYTFTLRDDIQFHSGNQLTAADVKYSLERLLDINEGYASQFSIVDVDNVAVTGEYEIEIPLTEVYAPFMDVLVLLFIVDSQLVQENAADGEFGDDGDYGVEFLNNADAGSGPYSLNAFERGSSISFDIFREYWAEIPENAYERVYVDIITTDSTVRTLMRNEELHMTSQYQSEQTYQTLAEEDHIRVNSTPTATLLYFKLNTQRAPTDDVEVRKAIAHAFDYETARTEVAPGSGEAVGPVAPVFDSHNGDVPQPGYDPERAREILENAGYGEGDVQIEHTFVRETDLQEQLALLYQQNLNEVGIEVELNPQTWGTMTDMATDPAQTSHSNNVFYGPVYPSVDAYLVNQYYSESASTWMSMSHLQDSELDGIIEESRRTTDPDARADLYRDAQQRIAEQYPEVFVFVDTKKHAMNEEVQGYTYRPSMSFDYWFRDLTQE
ncbi:ABC transporter substrate-binding protein [Halorarum halobium]|uniref:ABC transporter substrate-binding protein n=1 Tax=Halorarum halobium TaxID=3075121 RepID=UPI0028A69314|nr:ABC transporter substrate-binding protein [Halobaculum sp. XH14]